MAEPRSQPPVLLVVAVFSRHLAALTWARQQLEGLYGPVALAGEPFAFTQTSYYEPTMGANLTKQLLAFHDLIAPDRLAEIKRQTNTFERDYAATGLHTEPRPLNLDPGILTLGKFLLATTKDQAHRIYLRDGIFAEVTLRFEDKAFHPWPWTYADYRTSEVRDFLCEARAFYRRRLNETAAGKDAE